MFVKKNKQGFIYPLVYTYNMKQTSVKEFNAMTLDQAVEAKKQLGHEFVKVEFGMDHRSKAYKLALKLVDRNVSNLADSKHGSAVQDELARRNGMANI